MKYRYLESEKHFINMVNKAIRSANRKLTLLPAEFYIEHIYDAGMAEDFTWALKSDGVHILEEPFIWEWLKKGPGLRYLPFNHSFTDDFLQTVESLKDCPGVYSFWSEDGTVLYVGRSKNLRDRIPSSFSRFKSYDRPIFLKFIMTNTASDSVVLEGYFIATLNPPFNGRDNFQDGITVAIEQVPEWSEPIRCNLVKQEMGVQ